MLSEVGQRPEATYDAFRHLWRSIIPITAKERLMVMVAARSGDGELTAYFDESGTHRHPRQTAVTVAGYISTVRQWEEFQVEWREMLDDQCLEYFHMAELWALNPTSQFSPKRGWNEQRRDDVLTRAHDIISRHVLKDFDSSLVWEDYDELITSYRGKDRPSAYAVLVNACLSQVGEWAASEGYVEDIQYVFESGMDDECWVKRNYLNAEKNAAAKKAFRFGGLAYQDKRKFPQLQAADVNAWESCKNMKDRILSEDPRPMRPELGRLKGQSGFVRTKYFDRAGLATYIGEIEREDF